MSGLYRLALLLCCVVAPGMRARAESVQQPLAVALGGTHASAVVLDIKTGSVIGVIGEERRANPGSALKPLLLDYALRHGIVSPETRVFCHRQLRVGSRSLPCTHPASEDVFTAETALANSCNSYFAQMALRFSSRDLEAALREAHIDHRPMNDASPEQRQLATLGLEGVTVTPLELAHAYRLLFKSLDMNGPVARGLAGSVSYGMANEAAIPGMTILGKTGTAQSPKESWTHGWFIGVLPGRLVVVIFVPHGDGGTAAALGRSFFLQLQSKGAAR